MDTGSDAQQPLNETEYRIAPNGELEREHWDGHLRTYTFLDGDTEPQFKQAYNRFLEPVDEALAAQSLLPPMFVRTSDAGDVQILSDGNACRLAIVAQELRSYQPRSWKLDQTLLKKDAITTKRLHFLNVQLVGDPQSGPFAVVNGNRTASASAYFSKDLQRLDVPPDAWCFDAGPRGFLVTPATQDMSKEVLQCFDATYGKLKWTRSDLYVGSGPVEWLGSYAVLFAGIAVDKQGHVYKVLHILDGETGKTVSDQIMSTEFSLWEPSGLDDMILLADRDSNYYGYQIVDK
jgi:hypothetical protein